MHPNPTDSQLAQARLSGGKSQLVKAMSKASSEDPPYSDNISVRRGIQSAKDIIKVEQETLSRLNSGVPVPVPLVGIPNPLKDWLTPPSFLPIGFNPQNGFL